MAGNLRICFFGAYDPAYSRNRVLLRGLKENGVEVVECNTHLGGLRKYWDLIKKHWQLRNQYEVMLVAFPSFQVMILARLLTRKKIIFDAFLSIYEANIIDRKVAKASTLRALYYWLLDWLSCKLANVVLLDTNAHIDFFVREFSLPRKKFFRVFVGTDPSIFYPSEKSNNLTNKKFIVHFHGSYIPLQGIEHIINAAKILENENIRFNLIGTGQVYNQIRRLADKLNLKNVNFIGKIPYVQLADKIRESDLCLGIFGDNQKAKAVIPNKAFETIACAKPLITADTLAIGEAFEHGKNCWLVPAADPEALAEAIIYLRGNHEVREKITSGGYELFITHMLPNILTRQLVDLIKNKWTNDTMKTKA
jgi:glycosyltransferase involved in cell wall biosynthesis